MLFSKLAHALGNVVAHADGAGPVGDGTQLELEGFVVVVVGAVDDVIGAGLVDDGELLEGAGLDVLRLDASPVDELVGVAEAEPEVESGFTELVAGLVGGPAGWADEQPPSGSPRPMAPRRHDKIFNGSEIAWSRHVAAAPTTKGPRAVVQAATCPGNPATGLFGISKQA